MTRNCSKLLRVLNECASNATNAAGSATTKEAPTECMDVEQLPREVRICYGIDFILYLHRSGHEMTGFVDDLRHKQC
jgi:hypothetical protein